MSAAEEDLRPFGTIWMLHLDEPVPVVQPRLNAVFRRLGLEAVSDLSAMIESGAAAAATDASAELLQRFQAGRQCYSAWVGDQLAAYGWASFADEYIGELDLCIRLLPGETYIWDCVTVPRFRGNYLYSALLAYMIKELRAQPVCRAWIGADLDNIASQKGMRNAGFHHMADLYLRRAQEQRQWAVLGQPGVPEPLVAEARRAFLGQGHLVKLAPNPAV
jgi:hypothetical protein